MGQDDQFFYCSNLILRECHRFVSSCIWDKCPTAGLLAKPSLSAGVSKDDWNKDSNFNGMDFVSMSADQDLPQEVSPRV